MRLACLAMVSHDRELFPRASQAREFRFKESLFRRDAETNTRDACATQRHRSIRGNNGTGLPTTCPSGNLPHSASFKLNRSSFPLNSIFQFS
jgi:hypothetical protein